MVSHLRKCMDGGFIRTSDAPKWLYANLHYEVKMGSQSYGVSNDDSDFDVYGFAIPPKEIVFPHLSGEIEGFGVKNPRFDQYQMHHVQADSVEYDFTIYNIVKYFQLCMDNNPNMIDSLFVPTDCVLYISKVGNMVRENRHMFLHKGSWHKFKGYAYSALSKIKSGANKSNPKRAETIEKFGFDVKHAYQVVRLINEVEQILTVGDLDLRKNNEHLKAIRRGEVSLEEIQKWFSDKELALEKAYSESTLPYKADEVKIKQLLLDCLEDHYGDLSSAIVVEKNMRVFGEELRSLLNKYDL